LRANGCVLDEKIVVIYLAIKIYLLFFM
jgi:hypothetical protein